MIGCRDNASLISFYLWSISGDFVAVANPGDVELCELLLLVIDIERVCHRIVLMVC